MMSKSPLRAGTAGWSVPSRYVIDIPLGGGHLERYARRLNAVEINSSFYRPHQRKTYERWALSTPNAFRFSVKLPKAITHERSLIDCGALLDRFAMEVAGLGDKLGILLLQLPPKAAFAEGKVEQFFCELRRRFDTPVAIEPRHMSWLEPAVDSWLEAREITRVAADPAPVSGANEPGGWKATAYFRWHGAPKIYFSDYDGAALTALKRRLDYKLSRGIQTWCIFDNTASGAALGNALTLTRT
jgi:uncharacterized protein YecE (DUF72 family)